MIQIQKIINAGEMKLAVIPNNAVSGVCSVLEVWGVNKVGHVFPVIDRGFDRIKFDQWLAKEAKDGVTYGIVIKKGGK